MGLVQPGEEAAAQAPNSSPQNLQGGQQRDGARSFTARCGRKTRGSDLKLRRGRLRMAIRKKNKITMNMTVAWKFSIHIWIKALTTWFEFVSYPALDRR